MTAVCILAVKAQDANTAAATVLGTSLRQAYQTLEESGLDLDREKFMAGVVNVFFGDTLDGMNVEAADAYIRSRIAPPRRQGQSLPQADEEAENKWVESMHSLPRVRVLPSGVVIQNITEGSGEAVSPHSTVNVMYEGRLSNGTVFDRTDEPFPLPLDHIVAGLREAMLLMHMGGTYRVIIPPAMGYGKEAVMDLIPANSALDFTIEL